jgi:hypothetical protein
MSAIAERSKNDNLVFFVDYLGKRPTGSDSPVTVKARDLDKNFSRTTVIENPDEAEGEKSYTVRYEKEGTVLEIAALPKGTNKGDLLYWNPESGDEGEWVVLSAPSGTSLIVLGFTGGTVAWVDTEDC